MVERFRMMLRTFLSERIRICVIWDSFVAHRIIQTKFIIFNETYCFYAGRQNFWVLAIWLSRQEVFSSLLVFSLHIRHSTFFMASNSTFILCGYISLQTKLWMIDMLFSLFIQIQQMRLKTEFQRVYPLWMHFVYVPCTIFWCYRRRLSTWYPPLSILYLSDWQ